MSLKFNKRYGNIQIDVDIADKYCLFVNDSGDGKTLFMHALKDCLYMSGISYSYFDYSISEKSVESIIDQCRGSDIVAFDNADLYLSDELISELFKLDCSVYIAMHCDIDVNLSRFKYYSCIFEGSRLEVKKYV